MKINPKNFRSQLESIKDLEERNLVFDALSDEDKRREIAFDSLQLTLIGKIGGSYRCYWSNSLQNIRTNNSKKFQEKLVNELPKCEVCARGAMMLSQIRLGNTVSSKAEYRSEGSKRLIKGFTLDSFEKMETEYEDYGYKCFWGSHPYKSNTTEKLQNICLNVIANGDFDIYDATDYLVDYLTK